LNLVSYSGQTRETLSYSLTSCCDALEESNYARQTFGNQKGLLSSSLTWLYHSVTDMLPFLTGISSDMYHQTGSYDASASREAQQRLQNFSGATAISSKYVSHILQHYHLVHEPTI